jgi:hypothetical protein
VVSTGGIMSGPSWWGSSHENAGSPILLSQAAAGEVLSCAGGSHQALIAFQPCLARFPAGVAQSAERLIRNEQVRGSIPLPGSFPRS